MAMAWHGSGCVDVAWGAWEWHYATVRGFQLSLTWLE